MKGKEWFSTLKTQGKISHEEYDKFIETVPEFEIPDNAIKAFDEKFMTTERAIAHPEVTKKLKFETLNPLSRDMEKLVQIIAKIDPDAARTISRLTKPVGEGREIPDTYKQSEAITNLLPGLFDKVKAPVQANDEDAKKKLEEQKRTIEELTEKFTVFKNESEGNMKKALALKDKDLIDYKKGAYLEKLASSYTFADAFKDTRPTLTKAMLGELANTNLLEYTTRENNEEDVLVLEQKDGHTSPKFNGNNPVTIKSLMDEKFKPFLKVNGVDADNSQTRTQQFHVSDQTTNSQSRAGSRVTAEI